MHKANITKTLSAICNGNQLETYGHGRGTRYHIQRVSVAVMSTENILLFSVLIVIIIYSHPILHVSFLQFHFLFL